MTDDTGYESNPRTRDVNKHVNSRESALRFLNGKPEKKLTNNTVVGFDYGSGEVWVKLHKTRIVEWPYHQKWVHVNTGGWESRTTVQRLNELLRGFASFHFHKRVLYVTTAAGKYEMPGREIWIENDGTVLTRNSSDFEWAASLEEAPRSNPEDETLDLEPNWHNTGQWALNGLESYIAKPGARPKARSKADRRSVLALLSTAAAASHYVHDIGTEVLALVGRKRAHLGMFADMPWTSGELENGIASSAYNWMTAGGPEAWNNLLDKVAVAAQRNEWGRVTNALGRILKD